MSNKTSVLSWAQLDAGHATGVTQKGVPDDGGADKIATATRKQGRNTSGVQNREELFLEAAPGMTMTVVLEGGEG